MRQNPHACAICGVCTPPESCAVLKPCMFQSAAPDWRGETAELVTMRLGNSCPTVESTAFMMCPSPCGAKGSSLTCRRCTQSSEPRETGRHEATTEMGAVVRGAHLRGLSLCILPPRVLAPSDKQPDRQVRSHIASLCGRARHSLQCNRACRHPIGRPASCFRCAALMLL